MITTIKDFKIMLENVSHMGFMPELSVSDTNSDNDSVARDQFNQLKLSMLSLNALYQFSKGDLTKQETIDQIKRLYLHYSPHPEVVDELIANFEAIGLSKLLVNWFGDIDSEYLMDYPDYELFLNKINDLIYKININLKN